MNRSLPFDAVWATALGLAVAFAAAPTALAADEIVEFRLTQWKSGHFDTAKDAERSRPR